MKLRERPLFSTFFYFFLLRREPHLALPSFKKKGEKLFDYQFEKSTFLEWRRVGRGKNPPFFSQIKKNLFPNSHNSLFSNPFFAKKKVPQQQKTTPHPATHHKTSKCYRNGRWLLPTMRYFKVPWTPSSFTIYPNTESSTLTTFISSHSTLP